MSTCLLIISFVSVNIARKLADKAAERIPSYDPATAVYKFNYDTSKMRRILGLQLRSKLETTADIVKDFASRGWLDQ